MSLIDVFRRRGALAVVTAPVLVAGLGLAAVTADARHTLTDRILEDRSLDGSENNLDDPTLGQAGTIYPRVAPARYVDDIGEPVTGPEPRYVSNRIFNDTAQNLFSDRGVTHWAFVWGQFLDHTFGLVEGGDEEAPLAFDPTDPLEEFTNDLGTLAFTRSAVADGTGVDSPRAQVNSVSSFIDAWAVYGGTESRLDWLRSGPLDGDPTNNEATLLDDDGYLPTAAARPGTTAPEMDLNGRLRLDPSSAVIAGDVRANENLGLAAVHTLFLREHNRIVAALPDDLPEQVKFAIARRVVGAEQQYVTFTEFLPAMGVQLDPYTGYDPDVDPRITDEFATVGYRAHSQIHGELEAEVPSEELSDADLAELETAGVEVNVGDGGVELAVPLNVAFFNPGLLRTIGLGNVAAGLATEAAYANDEQIDNQLRSVLFQVPGPDSEDPTACLDGPTLPDCFTGVVDLGALDVARGYDHGMPTYNELRVAYGLDRVDSFTDLTGEPTEQFPADPDIDAADPIDDPDILDVVALFDADGRSIEPGSEAADTVAVRAERRTTLAARLNAIFGDVDAVDAFTGMVSEPPVPGTELGELQLAMWTTQFQALRDGDRFFYGNDSVLDEIADAYGIDYRRTLAEIVADNTDVETELPVDLFVLAEETAAATSSEDTAGEEPPVLDPQGADAPDEAPANDRTRRDDDRPSDGRRRPDGARLHGGRPRPPGSGPAGSR